MSYHAINILLEKTSNWDKDERYMATNDLITELGKEGVKLDDVMEKRISAAILKQLDDSSNDVQAVAIKCLSILLKKLKHAQIGEISEKLVVLILEGKDQLRDIYSIGLKTLINDVPDDMGSLVCKKLITKLLDGINRASSESITRECIEILTDLVKRFGQLLDLEEVVRTCMLQLESPKSSLKKRISNCIGSVATMCPDVLLNKLLVNILGKVEVSSSEDTTFYVQTLTIMSRTVGHRLGKLLSSLVPIFIKNCGDPDDEAQQTEAMDDIRDHCFLGLESLALRCPRDFASHLPSVLKLSLMFMRYDPNYQYEQDGEQDAMDDDVDQNFDDQEFQGSDFEDNSWKIRKNAVKLLQAIVVSQASLSHDVLATLSTEFISRMKEREEDVRVDIVTSYNEVLNKIFHSHSEKDSAAQTAKVSGISRPVGERYPIVAESLPTLLEASLRQLGSKSPKTKSAFLTMLRNLFSFVTGGMAQYVPALLTGVVPLLSGKNLALRFDALHFARAVFDTQSSATTLPFVRTLLPVVIAAVDAEWYKIASESLRVLDAIVRVLPAAHDASDDVAEMVNAVYVVLVPRLQALDIDLEIKEQALVATGSLFERHGEALVDKLPVVLALLRKRLENEVTRIQALKTISIIADSSSAKTQAVLDAYLAKIADELAQLLRHQNRNVKQMTLWAIDSLLRRVVSLPPDHAPLLKVEIARLLDVADLQICTMALGSLVLLIKKSPSSSELLSADAYERVLALAPSSLLNAHALHALIDFLQEVVKLEVVPFPVVYADLWARAVGCLERQSTGHLARCIARTLLVAHESEQEEAIRSILSHMSEPVEHTKVLALRSIGEIGQVADIGSMSKVSISILSCFDSSSEEVKDSAAFALGGLSVANHMYLPVLLAGVDAAKHQYILLLALKESIVMHANNGISYSFAVQEVLTSLLRFCDAEDESVRNVVAECLGVLSYLQTEVLPVLMNLGAESVAAGNMRSLWTVITAVRYAVSRCHSVESDLFLSLTETVRLFVPLMGSIADLEIKKAAILMATIAAHHNPEMVPYYFDVLVLVLLNCLSLKIERVVDLGPFKHRVDDGLPIRKAAISCIEEISSLGHRAVVVQLLDGFLPKLPHLLADTDEVKLQVNQVVCRLCVSHPALLSPVAATLIEPYEKLLTRKPAKEGQQGAGPEQERALEAIKSTLRAILSLNRNCADLAYDKDWTAFYEKVGKNESVADILAGLKSENIIE